MSSTSLSPRLVISSLAVIGLYKYATHYFWTADIPVVTMQALLDDSRTVHLSPAAAKRVKTANRTVGEKLCAAGNKLAQVNPDSSVLVSIAKAITKKGNTLTNHGYDWRISKPCGDLKCVHARRQLRIEKRQQRQAAEV